MNKPNTLEEKTVKLVTEIKNGQTVATEIQNLAGTENFLQLIEDIFTQLDENSDPYTQTE